MPKAHRKPKTAAKAKTQEKSVHSLLPWSCRQYPDRLAIEAYVMGSGEWETIVEVKPSAYVNTEEVGNFIVKAVNDYERHQKLIGELISALELCLECEGITWEAEQEASAILHRAKGT